MRVEIEEAAERIRAGELVVIATDTVYGLAASLNHPDTLARVYSFKGRPEQKPLPILGGSLKELCEFAVDNSWVPVAQQFWPGPLTLVVPAVAELPGVVVGLDGTVALRWPAGGQINQLLALTGPLAVTSANRSGERPVNSLEELEQLGCPYLLAQEPLSETPSTIIRFSQGRWQLLRAGSLPFAALQTDSQI